MAEDELAGLTPEEREELTRALGYGSSLPESKQNVHTFLHNVATADDTTKLGNLSFEEVGMPRFPLRTFKEVALISEKIMMNDIFKDYYNSKGEILTSTSLSKEALLLRLAVTQKRELADVTKVRKANKLWFKRKDPNDQEEQSS